VAGSGIDVKMHFSAPVFQSEMQGLAGHREHIIERVRELRVEDPGIARSNLRGWHSGLKLHMDGNEHVAWLFRNIKRFTMACIRNFLCNQDPGKLEMMTSWANINSMGSWNMPHMHLPADWSGVFYLEVNDEIFQEKGDGDLILIDPMPAGSMFRRTGTVNLRPRTGLVVLFPGYQMHMVAPHFGETERISVAFNYKLRPHA